ncbi:MAG: class I mannose-6-phosphate isomerase, partial [Lentisphaeraceae bacterium]|nr:class I mannose-6-phosphate isomerase [Lentisphaeraceae bacterium]
LSLQVHPDEVIAKKFPGAEPKNEMWYILDHDDDAQICAGLRFDKTQLQFRTRIGTDKLEECVQTFSSKKGDAYYIAAGTVHSIGGGNLILEVQQNSDTTFRVHDWGRVDLDGKPRQLHVEEALESIHFKDRGLPLIRVDERPVRANKKKSLVRPNKFFTCDELKIVGDFFSKTSEKTFHLLSAVETPFTVKFGNEELEVPKGDTCLLPAALGEYQILPQEGRTLTVIRSKLSM